MCVNINTDFNFSNLFIFNMVTRRPITDLTSNNDLHVCEVISTEMLFGVMKIV